MSKIEYAIGDLVELKSGAPVMTVVGIVNYDRVLYDCSWFSGKKNEKGRFPAGALTPAKPTE
jgi:uncharacterized protein YodC (DUF2158 family)